MANWTGIDIFGKIRYVAVQKIIEVIIKIAKDLFPINPPLLEYIFLFSVHLNIIISYNKSNMKKNIEQILYVNYLKNWKYLIKTNDDILFDNDNNNLKEILVTSWNSLSFFAVIKKLKNYNLKIEHETNSSSEINLLIFWNKNKKTIKVISEIKENNVNSKINIINIIAHNWENIIDSQILIPQDIINSNGDIKQENIFIWESKKLISIPRIKTNTSNSSASHSLKIHTIPEDKTYYLEQRWINKLKANQMIISGIIKDSFGDLFEQIKLDFNI